MSKVEKDDYPADEFVIYSLCRLYDVHCILLTKYEPWSTISRQFSMAVEDVWAKSDLRLVLLEPGCYGEIKNIRQPPSAPPPPSTKNSIPQSTPSKQPTKGRGRPKTSKTTNIGDASKQSRVRASSRSRNNSGGKPRTLQESRDLKYGLQTSRPVRQNRRNIDYCKLNDGLEESVARSPSPKRSKKSPLPARSGPSSTRMSAQNSPPPKPSPTKNKNKLIGATANDGTSELVGGTDVRMSPTMNKNKLIGASTLIGGTTDDGTSELVGSTDVTPKSPIQGNSASMSEVDNLANSSYTPLANVNPTDDKLPDLVLNRQTEENTDSVVADPPTLNTTQTDAATTEDEEDAAEALLRLGDDMNLGPIDDNSELMPIGGTGEGVAKDAVPVPIKLSEKDVQEAVRNLDVTSDGNNNTVNDGSAQKQDHPPANDEAPVESPSTPPRKANLKLKSTELRRKVKAKTRN